MSGGQGTVHIHGRKFFKGGAERDGAAPAGHNTSIYDRLGNTDIIGGLFTATFFFSILY